MTTPAQPPAKPSSRQSAASRVAGTAGRAGAKAVAKKRGQKKGRRKKALKQDEPHRMCIVCRASKTQEQMLRFARSVDGAVGFDIKAVLPGRGAWVCAQISCLEKATDAKQGGFSRAFDAAVVFDGPALRDNVKTLLMGDVLARLGLLRRQNELVLGRDEVFRRAERVDRPLAFVGLAKDLSENSRREVTEKLPTMTFEALPEMERLADALGSRAVGVVGVVTSAASDALALALHRAALAG